MRLLDDDRLQIAFQNDNQVWTELTLPPLTEPGSQQRAVWSAELDGYVYRMTAISYSDNVYVFRLEKYLGGKLIEGEEPFYAIGQKLRPATGEEIFKMHESFR